MLSTLKCQQYFLTFSQAETGGRCQRQTAISLFATTQADVASFECQLSPVTFVQGIKFPVALLFGQWKSEMDQEIPEEPLPNS